MGGAVGGLQGNAPRGCERCANRTLKGPASFQQGGNLDFASHGEFLHHGWPAHVEKTGADTIYRRRKRKWLYRDRKGT